MSTVGSGYDLASTTFSPDGRVFQVEYAYKAVDNGGTVLGIKAKNGIVLAVEKLVQSKLILPKTGRRIFSVDLHAGIVSAGYTSDGRKLATQAAEESKNYRNLLDQPIPGKAYTLYSSVRPFGIASLVATHDPQGFHLYMIEPSGNCLGYMGCAAGKGKQAAKAELEKLNFEELDVLDAAKEAARIIYAVHDESKDKLFELEMSWISPQSMYRHELVPSVLMTEAEAYAKQCLESQMED